MAHGSPGLSRPGHLQRAHLVEVSKLRQSVAQMSGRGILQQSQLVPVQAHLQDRSANGPRPHSRHLAGSRRRHVWPRNARGIGSGLE